jgi:hypothetical protein
LYDRCGAFAAGVHGAQLHSASARVAPLFTQGRLPGLHMQCSPLSVQPVPSSAPAHWPAAVVVSCSAVLSELQSWQETCPVAPLYFPAAHAVHSAWPATLVYLPFSQAVQQSATASKLLWAFVLGACPAGHVG